METVEGGVPAEVVRTFEGAAEVAATTATVEVEIEEGVEDVVVVLIAGMEIVEEETDAAAIDRDTNRLPKE